MHNDVRCGNEVVLVSNSYYYSFQSHIICLLIVAFVAAEFIVCNQETYVNETDIVNCIPDPEEVERLFKEYDDVEAKRKAVESNLASKGVL